MTNTDDNAAAATPANANSECVGPDAETAGKNSACEGCPNQSACASGAFNSPEAIAKAQEETQALKTSLSNVSHVVLVLSGKGGVGYDETVVLYCWSVGCTFKFDFSHTSAPPLCHDPSNSENQPLPRSSVIRWPRKALPWDS